MINLIIVLVIILVCFFMGLRQPKFFLSLVLMHLTILTSVYFDPGFSDFPDHLAVLNSINVYFVDIYSVTSLLLYLKLLFTDNLDMPISYRRFNIGVVTLLFLTLIGIVCWAFSSSIQTSVNFWRPYLLPLAFLIYSARVTRQYSYKEILKILLSIDVCLLLLLLTRILTAGLGEVDTNPGELAKTIRAINETGAFVLLSVLIVLSNFGRKMRFRKWFLIANAIGLILTLQRTMIVAGFCVMLFKSVNRRVIGGRTYILSFTYLIILMGIFLNYSSLLTTTGFQDASSTYTLEWRIGHWQERIGIERSFLEWLLGSIFGPNNLTDPRVFRLTSHNLFVDSLEFYGLIGFLIFVFLIVLRFQIQNPSLENIATKELTLVLLIFSFSYTPTPLCFLLWGLICEKENGSGIKTEFIYRGRNIRDILKG